MMKLFISLYPYCLFASQWRKSFYGILLAVFIVTFLGCQENKSIRTENDLTTDFQFIQSLDSLQVKDRHTRITEKLQLLETQERDTSIFYEYLKGYDLVLKNEKDSVSLYFTDFKVPENSEWQILREIALLENTTNRMGVVPVEQAESVFEILKNAEERNSVFTYKLYDIFAMIHYNNKNVDGAITYTEKYYHNHPHKSSNFIKQRYHDISFLLNERNGDLIKMTEHFHAARELAIENNDNTALMRTYDYESQVNMATMQLDSATQNMKKYVAYVEQNDKQTTFLYLNMGNLFYKNNQLDSAQIYFKKAIDWSKVYEPDANTINAYLGLSRVYAEKKEYPKAYAYLDTMRTEKELNDQRKRDDYIEQLQAQYAVEKKDKEIENLQLTNELNQKIISQTRWTFGIAILLLILAGLYGYTLYRRNVLHHRNRKLNYENQSLLLEQRLTQMQINPHFIHNAIANLQGLIVQDEKKTANRYLIALSKLIRNILELNRREFITIAEEIDALENYMKLQQMRMKDSFEYQIDTLDMDTDAYLLPPMLLQPFIENAIEHGFSNLPYPGRLTISFHLQQKKLYIHIEDNGNKGFVPESQKLTKKSLSQTIIQERLDLLFNMEAKQAWYEAGKKPNNKEGYEVHIYLPIIEA